MNEEQVSFHPDTITVSAVADEECEATGADIHVSVRGTSLFSGDTALKKAREVAGLVAALGEVGIEESSVELRGIRAEVVTGTLGNKTSSATYSLRITNVPLGNVADAIGVVTSQKNTDLTSTAWKYGDDEQIRLRLLETALNRVQVKANLTARVLGVSLLGVQNLVENFTDEEAPRLVRQAMPASAGAEMARMRVSSEELGLAVAHRKQVSQSVEVTYRVSPIA